MDNENLNPLPQGPSAPTTDENSPRPFSFRSFDFTKLILPVAIVLAGLMISGTLLYVSRGSSGGRVGTAQIGGTGGSESKTVSTDSDAYLGKKDAPVTIIEFSDYQCPFCRNFWAGTLPQIKQAYINTGKIKFVYRDFPLDFHPAAEVAAEAAECAGEQNKYWEMHDKIFSEQKGTGTVQFTVADIKKWARTVKGLEAAKFDRCLEEGRYVDEVNKDLQDGAAAGVSGTPTFFINGRVIVGAQPFSAFQAVIEEELQKAD